MRTTGLLLCCLLILLAGCAPKRDLTTVLPTLEAPDRWIAGDSGVVDSTLIPQGWWAAFSSAELNQFIQEALHHNYDLKSTAAVVQAAAAQARIAGSSLWPHLNAGGNAARSQQNFLGFPGEESGVTQITTTSYGVSMNLSWEIDLWGRLRAGRRAGVAEFQATQADFAGAQLSLAAQVSKAWFAAVESDQQLELAQSTYESWLDTSGQIESRYRRGLSNALALRQARSNLASAESALGASQIQSLSARRQLETLLRRYPGAQIELARDLPKLSGAVPAGIPANLISRRPDLAAAERRLVAAGATVASNQRSLYPIINLTGSTGTLTPSLENLLSGDFSVWSIAGAITQPIFRGGQLRANISKAKAQEEQAWNRFGSAVLFALMEVETALDNEGLLERQENALKVAAEEAGAALSLAKDQYSRGVTSFINLLEAQRSAFLFQSQYLTAQRKRLNGRIDLYVALGGGFSVSQQSLQPQNQKP